MVEERIVENPTWDEALESGKFIKFVVDIPKTLAVANARLERNPDDSKIKPGEIAFVADILEEDREPCEKRWEVNSNRLKKKLRPIFESREPGAVVHIQVLMIGSGFDTQYSVRELK